MCVCVELVSAVQHKLSSFSKFGMVCPMCVYVCQCVRVFACMCVCMCVCVEIVGGDGCVCACVCAYVFAFVCVYVWARTIENLFALPKKSAAVHQTAY